MTLQNGLGPAVLLAVTGSAIEVKWAPELQVSIDGQRLSSVSAVGVKTRDENGGSDATTIILTFLGGSGSATRTATISRKAAAFAANPTGDGFTATLQAL